MRPLLIDQDAFQDEPFVRRMYVADMKNINQQRAELPDDGTIPLPFCCYACGQKRTNYSMKTPEGLPICGTCINPDVVRECQT